MVGNVLVTAALFCLSVLLYVDRACISAAQDVISTDLRRDNAAMGAVFGAFALGYALCQSPAGCFADRFGPRKMLAAVVIAWSVFTALTGAAGSFVTLWLVRFLFGAGEAGAYPGSARVFYAW